MKHHSDLFSARLLILVGAALTGCEADPVHDSVEPVSLSSPRDVPTASDLATAHAYAERAETVFVGRVETVGYQLSMPDTDGLRLPFTVVTWRIDDGIKGVASATYSARFVGGPMADGRFLSVSEIPEFEVGDHDLLFVEGNGELGCPLVECAHGRVQILGEGDAHDGISSIAPGPTWSLAIATELRDAGFGDDEPAALVDLDAPFAFEQPRPLRPEELAERLAVHAPPPAHPNESEADRAERLAFAAHGFNPVLPR